MKLQKVCVNSGKVKILLGHGICFPDTFENFSIIMTLLLLPVRVYETFNEVFSNYQGTDLNLDIFALTFHCHLAKI